MNKYNLILGSKSPRRKSLLASLGFSFSVRTFPTDESFPTDLPKDEVAEYIARKKADAFTDLKPNDLLITADTTVVRDNAVLNKPCNKAEAVEMLSALSGSDHYVYTGVCLKTTSQTHSFTTATRVYFYKITTAEIEEYIQTNLPFDKAGSYGIQELLGHRSVKAIEGSYNNVVGLPTAQLYQTLKEKFAF